LPLVRVPHEVLFLAMTNEPHASLHTPTTGRLVADP
jgi:hypothetical protein